MTREATTKRYSASDVLPAHGSLAQIRHLIGSAKSVLDVGCSTGYLGASCPGNRFFGVDGNAGAVAEASRTYERAECLDLDNLPASFPLPGPFDVIVFADVLEHLLAPEHVLRYFKSHLAADGCIIVSLPNVALWRVRANLLRGRFEYADYGALDRTHLHFYTFKSARQLLEDAGFTVDHVAGAANALGPVVARVPALRTLLAINIILRAR